MMMMMSGRIVHALTIDDAANFRTDQRMDEQGDSRSRMPDMLLCMINNPHHHLYVFYSLERSIMVGVF